MGNPLSSITETTMTYTVTVLPSQALRNRKSVWGVKPTANKRWAAKAPLNQAKEPNRGEIR